MQRIHDVFAGQVIPAARDLLGEDGALHEEHGHGVGGDAGDEQPGHHIQWIGGLRNRSSEAYTSQVRNSDPNPATIPSPSAANSSGHAGSACGVTGKSGLLPSSGTRNAPATAAAQATGIKLRGFHSKSSSSTASRAAAT